MFDPSNPVLFSFSTFKIRMGDQKIQRQLKLPPEKANQQRPPGL
jgi:hypothetical protein